MSLLDLWRTNRDAVLGMSLPTVVRMAIDPEHSLKDNSVGSKAFREFLAQVESKKLASFATYCLENSFPESGQVLQDIVNEIGRRLGFVATNGRYRGVRNDIGYDGIWTANGQSLVVEVKTTDAYTIRLDVIASYRDRLVEQASIPRGTPILIVIGRNDTASLEAQVRGSRHAWSIRIVSIDALIKLMEVNLSTSSDDVTKQIHTILRPFEYTRIDQIVDLVFKTVEDQGQQIAIEQTHETAPDGTSRRTQQRTPRAVIDAMKTEAIERLAKREEISIQKRRNSLYSDSTDDTHAVAVVSRRYNDGGYWYAYHEDSQRAFLSQSRKGFLVLIMTDKEFAFAVPFDTLETVWPDLNQTISDDGRVYKHVISYESEGGFFLRVRNSDGNLPLEHFKV